MTTELATVDGEIIEQRAPMTLFGTDNPAAIIERASSIASALGDIIRTRQLYKHIGNHDHVYVEGWTLLGSMLGVFAEVSWSRPVEDGWEARAVARTLNGSVVGAAEAMCTRREGKWRSADDYAVRSMAQTRAVSKALRLPLGFIIELAGYSATPADEVDGTTQPQGGERASASGGNRSKPATTHPAVQRTAEEQALLDQILAAPGMTTARMTMMADGVGVPKTRRANADELREMVARFIETPDGVPTVAAGGGDGSSDLPAADNATSEVGTPDAATPAEADYPLPQSAAPNDLMDDILAVTNGEEVTPEPGTVEHAIARAEAKAAKAKVRA